MFQLGDIPDESNALVSRYSILTFKRSFLGEEDPDLLDKLRGELAGYSFGLWCGGLGTSWRQPTRSRLRMGSWQPLILSELGLRGACEERGDFMQKEHLYRSFEKWCEENHVRRKDKGAFFETFYNVFPYTREEKRRVDQKRTKW